MRRREFITLFGGMAAAWPLKVRAQTRPLVAFVYAGATSSEPVAFVKDFRQGLKEGGFIEGKNVAREYKYLAGQNEQLSALISDLIARPVAVIAGDTPATMAAKKATSTIPIVFATGADPVKLGLVASFNRPGGNVTGVSFLSAALEPKRLELHAVPRFLWNAKMRFGKSPEYEWRSFRSMRLVGCCSQSAATADGAICPEASLCRALPSRTCRVGSR